MLCRRHFRDQLCGNGISLPCNVTLAGDLPRFLQIELLTKIRRAGLEMAFHLEHHGAWLSARVWYPRCRLFKTHDVLSAPQRTPQRSKLPRHFLRRKRATVCCWHVGLGCWLFSFWGSWWSAAMQCGTCRGGAFRASISACRASVFALPIFVLAAMGSSFPCFVGGLGFSLSIVAGTNLPPLQTGLVTIVLVTYTVAQATLRPWKGPAINGADTASSVALLILAGRSLPVDTEMEAEFSEYFTFFILMFQVHFGKFCFLSINKLVQIGLVGAGFANFHVQFKVATLLSGFLGACMCGRDGLAAFRRRLAPPP